jgi:hypothetical protein
VQTSVLYDLRFCMQWLNSPDDDQDEESYVQKFVSFINYFDASIDNISFSSKKNMLKIMFLNYKVYNYLTFNILYIF